MNELKEKVSVMVQSAIDGEVSACEVYSILKNLKAQIDSGLEVITDEAMNEARDFNKGEVYFNGLWEFRSSQTYLNFTEDSFYTDLSTSLSERKKELNDAWKANQSGKLIVDSEGEQIPVLSVKTPAKEGLIFKSK